MLRAAIAAAPVALLAVLGAPGAAGVEPDLSRFTHPEGLAIEVFAPEVPNARQMALGDDGTLFVGTKSEGRVWAGDDWPEQYRQQIFIAEHGSWNRREEIGYRVWMVRLEGGRAAGYETFAEGWFRDGNLVGRPVDLLVLPDGSMLVSDDKGGRIYRISWHGSD